jgi:DNA invertase Pin-like site-specific DNA recombinase
MSSWFETERPQDDVKAGVYLRVSTLDQKEGHGIMLQKTKCDAMATVKGWEVIEYYNDEGVSGTIHEEQRPGFSKVMLDVKEKRIQALIVYALDRLGRDTQIVLRIVENLDECGIKVISCRENLDTSTPTGRFTLTIFAALSQLERDTIVERMKAGTEERRKIDGEIGGIPPTGYKREGGKLIIDDDQAKTVRYIFERRYIHFRYLDEIVSELNEKGIATPQRSKKGNSQKTGTAVAESGSRWTKGSLIGILDNEAKYRGGLRNNNHSRYPRILPDDFDERETKARRKLNSKKTKSKRFVQRSARAQKLLNEYYEDKPISSLHSYKRKKKIVPKKVKKSESPSKYRIKFSENTTNKLKQYEEEKEDTIESSCTNTLGIPLPEKQS